jgi:hypothetical protein
LLPFRHPRPSKADQRPAREVLAREAAQQRPVRADEAVDEVAAGEQRSLQHPQGLHPGSRTGSLI